MQLTPDLIDKIIPWHWVKDVGVIGLPTAAATLLLLILPTPEKWAEVWVLDAAPKWYVRLYNVVRYVATLNIRAGWQAARNGNGGAK